MVVKAICNILQDDAQCQAILGENKAASQYKAYAGICPQPEKYPYSVVRLASKPAVLCKDGLSGTFNGTVAIHCFHRNYDDVVLLCDAVVAALQGKKGVFHGYYFQLLSYDDMADGEYSEKFSVHQRVIVFRAIGYEAPAT